MKFKVWTLDMWGEREGGFEENDRYLAGAITVADDATDETVWRSLVDASIAQGSVSDVTFEWSDSDWCNIDSYRTGMPLFQLTGDDQLTGDKS